jgi:mono/diheme cytochrome c family protein
MRRFAISLLAAAALIPAHGVSAGARGAGAQAKSAASPLLIKKWHAEPTSSLDLAVGGDLTGLPPGTTRYVAREDLLALPQTTYTVTDDTKFSGPTQVSGVPLEELIRVLGGAPDSDLVVAICNDGYRANYPSGYIAAHHPLLVLEVNGKAPADWPKDAEHGNDMGPYTISHPKFIPSFKVFAHADEPQIPWGVIRLEFRDEREVFGAIAPRGPHAKETAVQAGYRIAQQNCFLCHNVGREGGQKSGRPWLVLSAWATASPDFFAAYVRDPKTKNPHSEMPAHPDYDDATIRALIAYFRTFSAASSAEKR